MANNTNPFTKTVKTLDDYKEEFKNNPQILRNIKKVQEEKAREAAYFKRPQNKPTISFDIDDNKPLTSKQRNELLLTCMGKIIECIAETL